jgi:hypothetical protein
MHSVILQTEIQIWRNKYFIVVFFKTALKLLFYFLGVFEMNLYENT